MWPVIAIAAASALAQWHNSEKARKANKEERKRMEQLVNKLNDPHLDESPLTPEEFKLIGKYTPQVANFISEKAPEIIKESSYMKEGRDAQMDALKRLRDIARADKDPALMAQLDLASRSAQADAQSRQASLLQDAARRGQASGLNNLMAQMQAGESAMDRRANEGRLAAIEAYRNKLAAMRDSAELGERIREGDINLQARNTDIINDFNQRTAASNQNYLRYASDLRNEAQLRNLENQQAISNANVELANQFSEKNRARFNSLEQQRFANELNKAGLSSDIGSMNMQANTQNAQDRNSAVQGLANAGTSAYMYNQNRADAKADRDSQERRAVYARTGFWGTPDEYNAHKEKNRKVKYQSDDESNIFNRA